MDREGERGRKERDEGREGWRDSEKRESEEEREGGRERENEIE